MGQVSDHRGGLKGVVSWLFTEQRSEGSEWKVIHLK